MNHLHAHPASYPEHAVIDLHAEMARLRYDHEHERIRICLLALLLPLATLLLAAEYIGGDFLYVALTTLVLFLSLAV